MIHMSNLIYGPDGKPLPDQETENPYQLNTSEPSGNLPQKRHSMDLLAFGCGLFSIFMIGSSGYMGIALMFGSGVAAVLFAVLTKKEHRYRSRLGTAGMVMGIIAILFSMLTIFSLIFFLSHQEEMKAAFDSYMQMYEQLTGQPFPEDMLNAIYQ